MKRVLVTGANGQLGLALKDAAKGYNIEFILLDKNSLDITDSEAIKRVFSSQSLDVCINTAAYTDVGGAEINRGLAYAINAKAVETLAKVCKQYKCRLVHISTDYVFDGTFDRPYNPTDTPNPLNVYGASKLAGELAIKAVGGNYSIVRTSWLYSKYGNNFYTKLQAQLKTGKRQKINDVRQGCPTKAEDLATYLLNGIFEGTLADSVSHYCGNKVMTWFKLAKDLFPEYHKIIKSSISVENPLRPAKVILVSQNKY